MHWPPRSVVANTYLAAVVAAGTWATGVSLADVIRHPVHYSWYVFTMLAIVSGAAKLKVPAVPAHFSISDSFTITAAVVFGPSAATVMVAVDTLLISYRMNKSAQSARQFLFDTTVPPMAMWLSAHAFFLTASVPPLIERLTPVDQLLLPLVVLAFLYYAINSGSIAVGAGFEQKQSPVTVWRAHFQGLWWNYFAGAAAAAAVVFLVSTRRPALTTIAVFVPLPLILYFAFKNAMGRVDDQFKHLAQVNRLYLSTIEALAHAIDAKDQTTHGHIRRVQHYAIRLAEALGIQNEVELKAIEAAGLLHDMGKLAVPEHILNKPGKLTPAEFEKMKLHASVGADILSSIDFPYPVIPIVRHHHENWDGTGYPAGLKRLEIPIGARILSVVDCFDALTSDRPYRPRVTDEAAVEILLQRRGTMYDPVVVDTFVGVHRSIAPQEDFVTSTMPAARAVTKALEAVNKIPAFPGHVDDIDILRAVYALGRALPELAGLDEIGEVFWKHARQVMPDGTLVMFGYDTTADRLVPRFIAGHHAEQLRDLHIQVGQHLTGWVAANRAPMLNADAALDLGELRLTLNPRLRSCASMPCVAGKRLLGVVTYYAAERDPFSEEQGRFLQVLAERLPEICDFERQPRKLVTVSA